MGKIVNQTELSEIVGKTDVTIWAWQEQQGLPVKKQGSGRGGNEYDTAEVINWMIQRELRAAGKPESQRDRLARLQADHQQFENEKLRNEHVPASDIEPTWKTRILAAAALMMTRQSRLAALLEATLGLEAKRELLKKEDATFLTRLGQNGEELQIEIEGLLAEVSTSKADAFLRRIAGHDKQSETEGGNQSGVGDVRPPEAGTSV